MRVLLKVQIAPTVDMAPSNGSGPPALLGQMMERLHPEAAYFYAEGGRRTSIIVFELESPADMPTIAEPLMRALGDITIDWSPCMDISDLQAGLSRLAGAAPAAA